MDGRMPHKTGYSASRKTTIDVTHLIAPQTNILGFNMFSQLQGGRC
jgi:NADPH:quinone reductase